MSEVDVDATRVRREEAEEEDWCTAWHLGGRGGGGQWREETSSRIEAEERVFLWWEMLLGCFSSGLSVTQPESWRREDMDLEASRLDLGLLFLSSAELCFFLLLFLKLCLALMVAALS